MLKSRLAADQEQKKTYCQILKAEAEVAEVAIITDSGSARKDHMSLLNDIAPSIGSREKIDAFLNNITGNNDEPDFDQNDGAPATAALRPVSDKPFAPLGGAAESAIFLTSSRAIGPDLLKFSLSPVS